MRYATHEWVRLPSRKPIVNYRPLRSRLGNDTTRAAAPALLLCFNPCEGCVA